MISQTRSDTVQVLVPNVERWLDGALPLAKTLMSTNESNGTSYLRSIAHFIDFHSTIYLGLGTYCVHTQVHDGRSSTVAIWTCGCDFPDCRLAAKCDE